MVDSLTFGFFDPITFTHDPTMTVVCSDAGECTSDNDCPSRIYSPSRYYCNVTTETCFTCHNDSECSGYIPARTCDLETGLCTTCTSDADCPVEISGSPGNYYDEEEAHCMREEAGCRKCATDAQCAQGQYVHRVV